MNRLDLLGLTKDSSDIDKEEKHFKRQSHQRELFKDRLNHRTEIWRMKHAVRVEKWRARSLLMSETITTFVSLLDSQGIRVLILIGVFVFAIIAGMFTIKGTQVLLYGGDPIVTSKFYVEKDVAANHGVKFYAVRKINGAFEPNETLTEPMSLEAAIKRQQELKALFTPNATLNVDEVSGQTPCWVVKHRVWGSDDNVSTCYKSFEEADKEKIRLLKAP